MRCSCCGRKRRIFESFEKISQTSYLTNITKDTVFRYTKTKLAEAYKTEGAVARIASVMPEEIR